MSPQGASATLAARMPERVISFHESDRELWQRFSQLAGDEMPSILARLIRQWVDEQDRIAQGMYRIEVPVVDDQKETHVQAFNGRWIIPPEHAVRSPSWNRRVLWTVAETERGRYVTHGHDPERRIPDEFDVFQDKEEMAGTVPHEVMDKVLQVLGERPVTEREI